jgi:4-hydroxybenzoate polyprenyltransferase
MSIFALMVSISEKSQNPLLLAGVGVLTAGIYIFHRVSIVEVEPMQARHRIALRHSRFLYIISCILLVAALGIFAFLQPWFIVLVGGAIVGIVVYGRKIVHAPLRNVTFVKPFAVGASIAAFAWVLNDCSNVAWTLGAFFLLCSADALICDLVDYEYDVATGCQTLASKYSAEVIWSIAGLLYIGGAFCLLATVGWLFLFLFPAPLLAPKMLRTSVDMRPLLVLLLAWSL